MSGFDVLDVVEDGVELVVEVETSPAPVGCVGCGTRAVPKDRRWVTLRDAPSAGRPVRVRWRKRIWACPDGDCEVRTWTETAGLSEPRRVLTTRAAVWATNRLAAVEGSTASIARGFGVSWSTVWAAVERVGVPRVEDQGRVGPVRMVGFDETVMRPLIVTVDAGSSPPWWMCPTGRSSTCSRGETPANYGRGGGRDLDLPARGLR